MSSAADSPPSKRCKLQASEDQLAVHVPGSVDVKSIEICWQGPIVLLDACKFTHDLCQVPVEFAAKLASNRKPEQDMRLHAGVHEPFQPAQSYWLMKMPTQSDSDSIRNVNAFILLSQRKSQQQIVFHKRIDSFFNGGIGRWMSWSALSRLSYHTPSELHAYCYLGFQPFTELEERLVRIRAPNANMQKYKCKLGFHHVRDGQE